MRAHDFSLVYALGLFSRSACWCDIYERSLCVFFVLSYFQLSGIEYSNFVVCCILIEHKVKAPF